MDSLRAPGPLNTTGEASKNWQTFKQRFELFLAASEPDDKKRSVSSKTALFLSVAGKQLLLADMLSRATTKTTACDLDSNDVEVHADNSTRVRRIAR
ncbi:uncharacterized protein [Dermacentor albipictus]|uniref:uncharacterized protein isoform X2 n=1 Tax=Dermacentor albipictus TaxID=60249 RepID=UPI0031FDE1AB